MLRCSLRIGDKYAVHTNGYLIDLTAESENSSYDGSIQGRRNGGRPMEHSSTDASPAMQTAMQEFLDQAEGGQVRNFLLAIQIANQSRSFGVVILPVARECCMSTEKL